MHNTYRHAQHSHATTLPPRAQQRIPPQPDGAAYAPPHKHTTPSYEQAPPQRKLTCRSPVLYCTARTPQFVTLRHRHTPQSISQATRTRMQNAPSYWSKQAFSGQNQTPKILGFSVVFDVKTPSKKGFIRLKTPKKQTKASPVLRRFLTPPYPRSI